MPPSLAKVDDNIFNKKTALVKHVVTRDHQVDLDHSKILTFVTDYTKRRFLESIFIHNSKNAINDTENCFILKFMIIWRYLLLVLFAFKLFVLPFSFDCVAHYLYCLARDFAHYQS